MSEEKIRVLIVAQGLEYERILAAISLHHPTKLIILRSKEDVSPDLKNRVNKIIEGIVEHIRSDQGRLTYPWITQIQHNTHHINFFDLTEAISQIDQIIEMEKLARNTVAVDLSSGNKIIALALFIVCTLQEIPMTYCVAGRYAPGIQEHEPEKISDLRAESIAFSVTKHEAIPILPLEVSKVPFGILKELIAQNGKISSIKELVECLKKNTRIDPKKKRVEQSDIVKISRQIEILEGLGYVQRTRQGRKVAVNVTEKGMTIVELTDAPSFQRKSINSFN